ncbi:MAG: ATP cone domain-containing protein, partial [Synechococcales cyanobacterium]
LREVNSSEIGEMVLQSLRSLSEVAYIRFASVYRQFQSIRDFVEALDGVECPSASLPRQYHAHEDSELSLKYGSAVEV